MGIYVQCFADLPANTRPAETATRIGESARAWAESRDLQDLFYATEPSDDGIWLTFYPPMGGMRFGVVNGRIRFDAKTSVAGPGFHVALVDLCDRLQRDVGLKWRWDSGGDQTGFAVDRNLDGLFGAFADQFFAFCDFYETQAATYQHHALNLAEGVAMDGHQGVATPLGPLPIEFFLEAKENRERIAEHAAQIFPWWDVSPPTFWLDTLRALLWTEVEWRAPRAPWEAFVVETIERIAKRVDLSPFPEVRVALDELRSLTSKPDSFTPPAKMGIGYLRHPKGFFLTGSWRINLPGYYIEQSEEEGNTVCLWFGAEEIRGSSFTVTLKEGASAGWSKMFGSCTDRKGATCTYRVLETPEPSDTQEGHYTAWAEFQASRGEGVVEILLLSLFDCNHGVVARIEAVAKGVWFNPPVRPAKQLDA